MKAELHRQLNFLAGCPIGTTTMDRADAKALLLETGGNMLACGRLYDFVVKDIGADVCKISLTPTHP